MDKKEVDRLIKNHVLYSRPTAAVKEAIEFREAEVKALREEVERLRNLNRQMMNRCQVYSGGVLCVFCGCRAECLGNSDAKGE